LSNRKDGQLHDIQLNTYNLVDKNRESSGRPESIGLQLTKEEISASKTYSPPDKHARLAK